MISPTVFAMVTDTEVCAHDELRERVRTEYNKTVSFSLLGKVYTKKAKVVEFDENGKIALAYLDLDHGDKLEIGSEVSLKSIYSDFYGSMASIRFSKITGNPIGFANFHITFTDKVKVPKVLKSDFSYETYYNISPYFILTPEDKGLCFYYGEDKANMAITSSSMEKIKFDRVTFKYSRNENLHSESLRNLTATEIRVKYKESNIKLVLSLEDLKITFPENLVLANLTLEDFTVADSKRIQELCSESYAGYMGLSCKKDRYLFIIKDHYQNPGDRNYSFSSVTYTFNGLNFRSFKGLLTPDGIEILDAYY